MGIPQTQTVMTTVPRQRKPAPLSVENPASLQLRIEQLEQRVSALETFFEKTQQSWGAVVLAASNEAVRALGDARKASGDQP